MELSVLFLGKDFTTAGRILGLPHGRLHLPARPAGPRTSNPAGARIISNVDFSFKTSNCAPVYFPALPFSLPLSLSWVHFFSSSSLSRVPLSLPWGTFWSPESAHLGISREHSCGIEAQIYPGRCSLLFRAPIWWILLPLTARACSDFFDFLWFPSWLYFGGGYHQGHFGIERPQEVQVSSCPPPPKSMPLLTPSPSTSAFDFCDFDFLRFLCERRLS